MGTWAGRAVAGAVCVALSGFAATAAAATAVAAPDEWDERVLPFVRFVERERGLKFDHPVKVEFLSGKAFERKLLEGDDVEETDEDRAFEDQLSGELVALGLAAEQVDLSDAQEEIDASTTVGFYDTETEELVVRGKGVDSVDAKVTIVHELTHALQDQRFDLDALYEDADEGSESLALDFLTEGDATAVEDAYLESLSAKEQEEYWADTSETVDGTELSDEVPYALDLLGSAPYELGAAYVYALDPDGGTKGRDRAYRHPPMTEEVLVDPVALEHDEQAVKVPAPKLADGEKKAYDPEQFGVITLYLMLATRLDARTALEAVTGWGGDRYLGFTRDGAACVRTNVTGDTERDTDELESALTAWAATMPNGAAQVSRADDLVTFTACETEGITEPSEETFDSVFSNVLGGRIYTVLDLVSAGVPLRAARCVGDGVSTDPTAIVVYDAAYLEDRELTSKEEQVLDEAYGRSFEACGFDAGGP
jgi:hypothetical protein